MEVAAVRGWIGCGSGLDHCRLDARAGAITPNGQVLAFVRGSESTFGLWIASFKGGSPEQYLQVPFPQQFREAETSQVHFSIRKEARLCRSRRVPDRKRRQQFHPTEP